MSVSGAYSSTNPCPILFLVSKRCSATHFGSAFNTSGLRSVEPGEIEPRLEKVASPHQGRQQVISARTVRNFLVNYRANYLRGSDDCSTLMYARWGPSDPVVLNYVDLRSVLISFKIGSTLRRGPWSHVQRIVNNEQPGQNTTWTMIPQCPEDTVSSLVDPRIPP